MLHTVGLWVLCRQTCDIWFLGDSWPIVLPLLPYLCAYSMLTATCILNRGCLRNCEAGGDMGSGDGDISVASVSYWGSASHDW